jgi:hypothetical protein
MKYDDMLSNLSSQIKQAPKKALAPMQSQTSNAMADMVASHVVSMLVDKINEKTPPQQLKASLSIEHDAKHWEGLIEKLKELTITPPSVNIAPASINVSAPDNTAIANALIEHGQHMAKLGRLLTQKKSITLNVLRDEDGKMAQIIIEQE